MDTETKTQGLPTGVEIREQIQGIISSDNSDKVNELASYIMRVRNDAATRHYGTLVVPLTVEEVGEAVYWIELSAAQPVACVCSDFTAMLRERVKQTIERAEKDQGL